MADEIKAVAWVRQSDLDEMVESGHGIEMDVFAYWSDMFDVDVALYSAVDMQAMMERVDKLEQERYQIAYAITGGEDAPGLLDSLPADELVKIARDAHARHAETIDRVVGLEEEVRSLREHVSFAKTNLGLASCEWCANPMIKGYVCFSCNADQVED